MNAAQSPEMKSENLSDIWLNEDWKMPWLENEGWEGNQAKEIREDRNPEILYT